MDGTLFLESVSDLSTLLLKKKKVWFSTILIYCINLIYYNYFHGIFYFEIYSLPILKPRSLFWYLEIENFCFEMWLFVCNGLFGAFLFRVVEWKCWNLCELFQSFINLMIIISKCELTLLCIQITALHILSLAIKTECTLHVSPLCKGFRHSGYFLGDVLL